MTAVATAYTHRLKTAGPTHYGKVAGNFGLATRAAILVGLFFLEKILLAHFVDLEKADAALGAGELFRHAQHFGFRFVVALVAAVTVFAFARGNPRRSLTAQVLGFRSVWMVADPATQLLGTQSFSVGCLRRRSRRAGYRQALPASSTDGSQNDAADWQKPFRRT